MFPAFCLFLNIPQNEFMIDLEFRGPFHLEVGFVILDPFQTYRIHLLKIECFNCPFSGEAYKSPPFIWPVWYHHCWLYCFTCRSPLPYIRSFSSRSESNYLTNLTVPSTRSSSWSALNTNHCPVLTALWFFLSSPRHFTPVFAGDFPPWQEYPLPPHMPSVKNFLSLFYGD